MCFVYLVFLLRCICVEIPYLHVKQYTQGKSSKLIYWSFANIRISDQHKLVPSDALRLKPSQMLKKNKIASNMISEKKKSIQNNEKYIAE